MRIHPQIAPIDADSGRNRATKTQAASRYKSLKTLDLYVISVPSAPLWSTRPSLASLFPCLLPLIPAIILPGSPPDEAATDELEPVAGCREVERLGRAGWLRISESREEKAMVNDPVNSTANPPALPDDLGQFILYHTNDGELAPEATIRKFRIVAQEGSREVARQIEHYNLDVIISSGHSVLGSESIPSVIVSLPLT